MTFADPLEISTSEGVQIHMTIAGLGSRMLAWIIDGLILAAFFLITGMGTTVLLDDSSILGSGIFSLIAVFAPIVYLLAMETLNSGKTVGKMAIGLKTIRLNGTPVGFGASLIRSIFVLIDFVLLAVGMICVMTTKRSQRFGDLVANTVVVRDRPPAQPAPKITPAVSQAHRADSPGDDATSESMERWDVSRVTPEEIDVIRVFLDRAYQIDNHGARLSIGRRLVQRIKPRVSGDSKKMNQEEWLRRVVASKDA